MGVQAMTGADTKLRERLCISENGCWIWPSVSGNGYGQIHLDGRNQSAHRVAYETWRGPIPEGLTIDHLCRNRACVNPDHLEPVTMRENVLRGSGHTAINAAKTHCPEGHPFSEENTYTRPGGQRACRTCRREQDKQRRLANRDKWNADRRRWNAQKRAAA